MWKKIGIAVLLATLIAVAAGCATQQQTEQLVPPAKTDTDSVPAQEEAPLPEVQPSIEPVASISTL